jgi:hypothetical protein
MKRRRHSPALPVVFAILAAIPRYCQIGSPIFSDPPLGAETTSQAAAIFLQTLYMFSCESKQLDSYNVRMFKNPAASHGSSNEADNASH